MRISLARTKQPVKPVLPVKDITVCVQWDLKGIIARTVSQLKSLSSPSIVKQLIVANKLGAISREVSQVFAQTTACIIYSVRRLGRLSNFPVFVGAYSWWALVRG